MTEEKIEYIGCIRVKESMKSLSHRQRSDVAKESINRLCRTDETTRYLNKKTCSDIVQILDDEPDLSFSGTDVKLSVTSTHLNVISKSTNQTIIRHEMPNVSFASSGDDETVDYVAYVAKEGSNRACYVLKCGYEAGKNVLREIAHGFELRSEILKKGNSTSTMNSPTLNHDRFISGFTNLFHPTDFHDTSLDASYKNHIELDRNDVLIKATRAFLEREPWFHGSNLTREESETRLKQDGDFLVRESIVDPGHFVLSVMHDGTMLHLLFDSMGKVKTKEMVFDNISSLIRYHHDKGTPIVAESRVVFLRNGVRPRAKTLSR